MTSLTGQTLFRLRLSADGNAVVEREALFEREYGRLRDVLVGPGGEVYLACSSCHATYAPDTLRPGFARDP